MDLETQKFHVSRDVVFHEDIFSFAACSKEQHRPLFQTPSQFTTNEDNYHIHGQHAVEPSMSHQVVHPNSGRPVREHRRPSYLQDYVCCSSTSKAMNYYCATLTNLCISPSNALTSIAANTSLQHIQEPRSYAEAVNDLGW